MARKRKMSVDYFPHFVNQGKTIHILQSRYGIRGYAFWFKLLEALSTSDGLYLSWDNAMEREYFTADAGVSVSEAEEILEVLVSLGNIDADLWHEKRIIWCQNLIDNLADVWQKRKQKTPEKPEKKESESSEKKEKNDPKKGDSSEKTGYFSEKMGYFSEKTGISGPEIKERNKRKEPKENKERKKTKVKQSKVEERKVVKESPEQVRTDKPTDPPTNQPTPHAISANVVLNNKTAEEKENAAVEEKTEEVKDNAEDTPRKVPLKEIQSLLLAYAEAKNIRLDTQKQRKAYLNSSPYFYEAKNVIEATGSLEKAKVYIFAQAEHYKAENKANWGLDWALQDFWKAKEQGTDTEQAATDSPKEPDSYRRCECGTLLGGATIRVETDSGPLDAAIMARCPMCGKIYGIRPLEDFPLLGIKQERLAEILRQSRIESFDRQEWKEWLELVP